MKYKVCWYEHHNPDNWGDTYREGLDNISKLGDIASKDPDGWVEVFCVKEFIAESKDEAIKIVANMQVSDVFNVLDENHRLLFTEEDI